MAHSKPTQNISRAMSVSLLAAGTLVAASAINAQSSYNGAVTPISEEDFLSSGGLGFVSSEELITDANGVPEGFIEMAAAPISKAQHSDEDIPGLHQPALPANQKPGSSANSEVSTADAYAASAASGAARSFSSSSSIAPNYNQVAAPLPSALIDSSNNGLSSVSLSGRRSIDAPAADIDVPSLTTPDYKSASSGSTSSGSSKRISSPLLDSDLSLPPIASSVDLPIPQTELPDAEVVVENALKPARAATKSSDDGDFAFVTRQLDKVGMDSQRMKVEIGTGMVSRPTYVGSDESEFMMVPHVDIEYMDRLFVSTERGIGVTVFDHKNFDADIFGTWRRGRDNAGDLAAFTDKNGGAAIGFEVGTNFGPFRLALNSDYAVTGDIDGLKSDLDLSYAQSLGNKFTGVLSLGTRVGDADYIDSLFGVSQADYQNTATIGLQQYSSSGVGLVDVHGGLDASYRFTPRLALNLDLGTSLLLDQAADSPVVDFYGKPFQWQSAITTRYKF